MSNVFASLGLKKYISVIFYESLTSLEITVLLLFGVFVDRYS